MKTLGLIGGMSWESTVTYYQIINQTVKEKLGGLHSARLILYSVEFSEIEEMQAQGKWAESGELLSDAARKLEAAGADYIMICISGKSIGSFFRSFAWAKYCLDPERPSWRSLLICTGRGPRGSFSAVRRSDF